MGFSAVILTKNEEHNILDCIESLERADEIIVIDDYSSDRTIEVLENLKNDKIKIYKHHLEDNFSEQRNFGLSKASGEWILFIDADERLTPKLSDEISRVIEQDDSSGFYIKRKDVMWGKVLRHGETGNIKLLRLGKKSDGKWHGKVHEEWRINGKLGTLKNSLMHYPHQTIAEFLSEINYYSTLRAEELHDKKAKVTLIDIALYPKGKFFMNYFVKLGFLDGLAGMVFALMMSFHSYLVRGKLWLLNQR